MLGRLPICLRISPQNPANFSPSPSSSPTPNSSAPGCRFNSRATVIRCVLSAAANPRWPCCVRWARVPAATCSADSACASGSFAASSAPVATRKTTPSCRSIPPTSSPISASSAATHATPTSSPLTSARTVFNTTPNAITGDPGERGGIWGGGMAADLSNTIFADTGNGTYDGVTDWGESYLKLQPNGGTMSVLDWFTPFNYVTLNNDDLDLGSAGSILLPPQPGSFPDEMIGSGKAGTIYVVNRDSLGHFHAGSDSQIIQSLLSASGR